MGTLAKIWKHRGALLLILEWIQAAVKGARSLGERRRRLAEAVQRGDLDDVVEKISKAVDKADDYVENG